MRIRALKRIGRPGNLSDAYREAVTHRARWPREGRLVMRVKRRRGRTRPAGGLVHGHRRRVVAVLDRRSGTKLVRPTRIFLAGQTAVRFQQGQRPLRVFHAHGGNLRAQSIPVRIVHHFFVSRVARRQPAQGCGVHRRLDHAGRALPNRVRVVGVGRDQVAAGVEARLGDFAVIDFRLLVSVFARLVLPHREQPAGVLVEHELLVGVLGL